MHYVYRITNKRLNKHYYGVRTSKNRTPKEDIGIYYFSSSSDKQFIQDQKDNPKDYKYKVIKTFDTREEAMKFEIKIHSKFNVSLNESFYNKANAKSTNFGITGTSYNKGICVGAKNGRSLKIAIYNQFNELQHIVNGSWNKKCSELNLPERQLRFSYKNNGEPIYQSKSGKAQANSNGNFIYIGWYAKII